MDTLFTALRVAVSLGAVLAVIWYAHRRITRGAGLVKIDRPITIIGRQGISQKASVVIVEAEGKRLLLGVTEHAITVLSDTPLAAPAAAGVPATEEEQQAPAGPTAVMSAPVFSRHLADAMAAAPVSESVAGPTPPPLRPRTRAAAARADARGALRASSALGAHTASPAPHGLLRGSILSAETWKLSLAVLRQGPRP